MKWRECQTITHSINKPLAYIRRPLSRTAPRLLDLSIKKRRVNSTGAGSIARASNYLSLFIEFFELEVVFRAYSQTMEAFVRLKETLRIRHSAGYDG